MVIRKNDRSGEDREPSDSQDAARQARRAARDKAFGKTTPARTNQSDPREALAEESAASAFAKSGRGESRRSSSRRALPMTGSASDLRRVRKRGPSLQAMLEEIDCDELAKGIKQKKVMFCGAVAIVGIAIIVWIVATVCGWHDVVRVTKFSLLAAPICLAFGINDLCMSLARTRPGVARNILSMLSFGNAHSVRNLAYLHMDTGDYARAEKVLSGAVRAIDAKKKLRDYIVMHAFLANLRAHIGRTAEAEQLIRDVLNAAETHVKEHDTDGANFLLANTLNYAAQLCDVKDQIQDALALSRRAAKLLCDHKNPPVDVALVSLYNAGYYCNVVGEFQDALLYLTKAQELAAKTGIARDGEMAFILSNLAIANLGVGRSTQCKRFLNDAETRAMKPLGMAERPHTYQCWAIYHFANDRFEYALTSYEKAIDYCSQQNPKENYVLLRIMKEYSVLLREVGKMREANENEQRVTQIRDTLFTLSAYVPTKKDKKQLKPLAVPVTKKPRIPIFWMILAGFWGFNVWEGGVRFAGTTEWLLFVTALVVVTVKLFAMFGPKSKQETSQGAIVAVVSLIPGLRSVVPELSTLPRKVGGIIIGAGVVLMLLSRVTEPPPDTVPDFGLLGQEYLVLGDRLAAAQSFNKARKAYELAIQYGENQYAKAKLIANVPVNKQPEQAIEENKKALELIQSEPRKAKFLLENCIRDYPDFEYPYVNLAAVVNPNQFGQAMKDTAKKAKKNKSSVEGKAEAAQSKTEKKAKAREAETLLQKALDINPNCAAALILMSDVKTQLGDAKTGRMYFKKYMSVNPVVGGGLIQGMMDASDKLADENRLDESDDKSNEPTTKSYEADETAPQTDSNKPARLDSNKRKVTAEAESEETPSEKQPGKKVDKKQVEERVSTSTQKKEAQKQPEKKAVPTSQKKPEKAAAKQPENKTAQVPTKKSGETPEKQPAKKVSPDANKTAEKKSARKPAKKPWASDDWRKFSPDDTDW